MKLETIEKILKKNKINYELVDENSIYKKLMVNNKIKTLVVHTKPQYDILVDENNIVLVLLCKDKFDKNVYERIEFSIEKFNTKDFLSKIKDCIDFVDGTYKLIDRALKICVKKCKEHTQDEIDKYKYGRPKTRSKYLN